MGNTRKFGRRITKINGANKDNRPGAQAVANYGCPDIGAYNAYRCDLLEHYTVVVHADKGVTPMFLSCQYPDCEGTGTSIGYPEGSVPDKLKAACQHEWYRPSWAEFNKMTPEMQDHIRRGGLELRRR